ncbi:MAG: CBS domain-containing protein [Dehalococcoidia bacterium]
MDTPRPIDDRHDQSDQTDQIDQIEDPASGVTVGALMSAPLVTIPPGARLWEARATMSSHGVHHLLVADRGRVVAIVSDRDIAHRLSPAAARGNPSRHDEEAMQRRVLQVAHFDMITIPRDAPIEEAAALILERSISALPVVDEEHRVVGIVTTRDLLRGMLVCVLPSAA